jgi:hypothetical protein
VAKFGDLAIESAIWLFVDIYMLEQGFCGEFRVMGAIEM